MPRLLDAAMTPASAMGQGENAAAQNKLRRAKRVIKTTQQAALFAPTRVPVAQPLRSGMLKSMKSSAKYAAPP